MDDPGVLATVFRDRVLALATKSQRCAEAMLLGHAIAHELGHLLLSGRHLDA